MLLILDGLIAALSAGIFLLPLLLLFERGFCKPVSWRHVGLILLLALYLNELLTLVGVPTIRFAVFDPTVNWIPFLDGAHDLPAYLRNFGLNILLFVPLGVFLPLLWPRFRVWTWTALAGLGLSGAVECLQLFTFRLTDTDDLLANTLGAIIGALLVRPLFRRQMIGPHRPRPSWELPGILLLVFAVKMLAAPVLADLLWQAAF